jgi:hypothetical protein
VAGTSFNAPPNEPIAVRAPLKIKTFDIETSKSIGSGVVLPSFDPYIIKSLPALSKTEKSDAAPPILAILYIENGLPIEPCADIIIDDFDLDDHLCSGAITALR